MRIEFARVLGAADVGAGRQAGDDRLVDLGKLVEQRIDGRHGRSHVRIGLFAHLLNGRGAAVERGREIGRGGDDGLAGGGAARRGLVGRQGVLQVRQHRGGRIAVLRRARRGGAGCAVAHRLGERHQSVGQRLLARRLRGRDIDLFEQRAVGLAGHRGDVGAAVGIGQDVGDFARVAGRARVRDVARDDRRLRRGRKERGVDDVVRGGQAHRATRERG